MDHDGILLKGVEKLYRSSGFQLGPIQLSIEFGQTIAVFGKNGAGKSTLFQLITGNLDSTNGQILINKEVLVPEAYLLKRRIGYLPQNLGLPLWVSGREILIYAAALYQLDNPQDRVNAALAYWDCTAFAHKPIAACSHGMQKRIGLALATFHEPPYLVLDEPFSGLDIYHIRALEDVLQKRQQKQYISIISTHVIPYASKYCQRAIAMDQGKLSEFDKWSSCTTDQRTQLIEDFFFASKA